ncbi:hypothetical protein [Bythopirellula polymerisocia]|uniref:Wadjet protein JetD C-terminal domain-containing protein n=1 Tax=Bythopirellula polymerisocia TaxID=2528003 RepID=A0A5C6CWC0_9BACT|nr:hypothetical protein [Bythopirellula polymerisocia]TWU27827.1 hypothetical protein Pla144_26040 [Bythopirellula polymerisocia]
MLDEIRDWFATHELDGGDFFACPSGYPFTVVPPKPGTETILYSTKTDSIRRLVHDLEGNQTFAAILRGGLPSDDDLYWFRSQVGSRQLLFWGDADPADLLTFAWLRESLPIQYCGLSDNILQQCGVELRDNLTIQLAESEVAALPLVTKCLGDLQSHLGSWCSGLLSSGRKIEVEALFSFAKCTPSELETVLLESGKEV